MISDEIKIGRMPQCVYDGEIISYWETSGEWVVEMDEGIYRDSFLGKVRKWIDTKKKEKFARIRAWMLAGHRGAAERRWYTVTSNADDCHVWVKREGVVNWGTGRSKERKEAVYLYCPENEAVYDAIQKQNKVVERAHKTIDELISKLVPAIKPSKTSEEPK